MLLCKFCSWKLKKKVVLNKITTKRRMNLLSLYYFKYFGLEWLKVENGKKRRKILFICVYKIPYFPFFILGK